jgi:hypothetical protein
MNLQLEGKRLCYRHSRAEEALAACERFPNLEILVNNLGTYEAACGSAATGCRR